MINRKISVTAHKVVNTSLSVSMLSMAVALTGLGVMATCKAAEKLK